MNDSIKKIMIIVILSFMFVFTDVEAACSYESLIQQYGEYAKNSMKETGVYASLTLAQGIQEQGLRANSSNNMFGIKMTASALLYKKNTFRIDSTDQTTLDKAGADCIAKGGSWKSTFEYSGNQRYDAMACFKKYDTVEGSFIDHGKWLKTSFANRNAFSAATDLMGQLKALVSNPTAMYATDPNYLCQLINHINSCDLTRFDTNPTGQLSSEGCENVPGSGPSNGDDLEHFGTSYTGDIKEGWLYKRFEFSETFNHQLPDYMAESNINDIIDVIFDRAKTSYFSTYGNSENGNGNVNIPGYGIGPMLPNYIKKEMSNPLGSQACNQSSCFGYYGANNCSTHSGVDLTSSTNAVIYAAANGEIVTVINNSRQCQPTFLASGAVCSPGCSGNIVTIKHSINGETWYTKYVHMASLDPAMRVGNKISKGDKIGIIGTSGCSTGIHLHFEIIGPNNALYNPEELLSGNCKLRSDCANARAKCGG